MPPSFGIQLAKLLIEHLPPNQTAQPVQLILSVENIFKAAAKYFQLRDSQHFIVPSDLETVDYCP